MPRVLAIGDIHGCYRSLRTLCELVAVREDDVVVTLGDYVDRGPDGWLACLDVSSGRFWQANERGETRQLWLDEVR